MKQIGYEEAVRLYLQKVCKQVNAKELHPEIKLELQSHILELVEEQVSEGMEREQAIEIAIRQMGDPLLVGDQLNKAHKARVDWSLLGLIGIFIGIGILAMYAIELVSVRSFFINKIIYSAIGIVCMLGLCFWDYRKLIPYSKALYIFILLVMGWGLLFGQQVNGSHYLSLGFTSINFVAISPFLLIICLAGIMATSWKQQIFPIKAAVYVLMPGFLYIFNNSLISLMIYLTGFGFMYFSLRRHIGKLLCYMVPPLIMAILLAGTTPYQISRFFTFINPYKDPLGMGYLAVQSIDAIQSAGWWGQGFVAFDRNLPTIESEMLYTYLIYSLGWITGIGIAALALIFLMRLAGIAGKVTDPYGSLAVKGILAMFTIEFIWSILMSFGMMPIAGVSIPFMSNGGMLTLVQMGSIGFILSIYRQKDTIPARSDSSNPLSP
ncbi:cell division protein FtsW, lipid II flippase [Paenibacillus sp. 1_12]|uniref:FtsW/RodA/SpoVE family cell cycle protein n=1 Tax=Paenibacillus sp. 1_12 TaxID=1566278 RepID=UPI0008E1256B|nr:FtsW/RodA/SpoVE family cell cycle protein [Paenibacillus sp. 1_12]SFL10567.1 cell division protein FtsW, lipid II flippase [Paenibacillus sp. 1_12]